MPPGHENHTKGNSAKPENAEFWQELVYRAVESDELDYKGPMNWRLLNRIGKGKLVRHCLALANTKGGYIVVGVAEDASGHPSVYSGLSDEEAHSFDPTPVGTFVNRCVDPPIDFTIERPLVDGKRYAIFVVRPFKTLPHVCINSIDTELSTGVFYIRTADASSRPAHRAIEMQHLIQRALRNQREILGRMLRGILYESRTQPENSNTDDFREDRKSARIFFERRRKLPPGENRPRLELSFIPEKYDQERFGFSELRGALSESWTLRSSREFIADGELAKTYATNVAVRSLPDGEFRMWQLFRSGMFHYLEWLTPIEEMEKSSPNPHSTAKKLDFNILENRISGAISYLGKLYTLLGMEEELLGISVKLSGAEGCRIGLGKKEFECRIPEISIFIRRSAADLRTGSEPHARKLLREVAERFNVPEEYLNKLLRPGVRNP